MYIYELNTITVPLTASMASRGSNWMLNNVQSHNATKLSWLGLNHLNILKPQALQKFCSLSATIHIYVLNTCLPTSSPFAYSTKTPPFQNAQQLYLDIAKEPDFLFCLRFARRYRHTQSVQFRFAQTVLTCSESCCYKLTFLAASGTWFYRFVGACRLQKLSYKAQSRNA